MTCVFCTLKILICCILKISVYTIMSGFYKLRHLCLYVLLTYVLTVSVVHCDIPEIVNFS